MAGAYALESLLIHWSSGFRCLRINTLSLRSIGASSVVSPVTDEPQLEELVIENSPCLQRLLRVDLLDGVHVSVISAPPKLETLGCISDAHDSHRFYSEIIQVINLFAFMWPLIKPVFWRAQRFTFHLHQYIA